MSYVTVTLILLGFFSLRSVAQTFEAEAGTLVGGVTVTTAQSGYTGSGYVTGFTQTGAAVTVWPWITTAGNYPITIRYRNPNPDKKAYLIVQSSQVAEITLPTCNTFCTVSSTQYLPTGSVGVGVLYDWGYYEIDSFTIGSLSSSSSGGSSSISKTPIDPNATQGAKNLLAYLVKIYGSYTLSGQQDPTSYAWVQTNIGKSPAILGSDFIDYSPSRVANGASSHAVEDAISHSASNGINAFVWHWNAPTCLLNTASEPWYSGFYTAATCFDVNEAINEGPNGANYKLLLRDIDAIAVQIKRLSDANIPILWRPLHEPDGGWFWWGAKGSGPFKALWNILYDRITNYHGLHNMVWVCNTMKSDWYPGNSKCDIVTTDIYASAGDHSSQVSSYKTLKSLTGGSKVIALAEVGDIPDPVNTQNDGAPWAYWMVWAGNYITDGSYNPKQYLYDIYSSAKIINRDQLGSWK